MIETTTLIYPKHLLDPEELMNFVELRPFSRRWDRLGLNTAEDLGSLQCSIMADPRQPIIQGTGGIRKMRFSPPRWTKGKRGALRIFYIYFEDLNITVLASLLQKNESEDLSSDEKKGLSKLIDEIRIELETRSFRYRS